MEEQKFQGLNAEEWLKKGLNLLETSDLPEAILAFTNTISLNPQCANAFGYRGVLKAVLGDKQGAITDYNEAIRLNPQDGTIYHNRGLCKYQLDHKKGAIADFNQAIYLKLQYADAYYDRGICKSNLGDKRGAIEDFNQGIRLNRKFDRAYNNRGICKSDLGDKQGAIADYNQAIRLNPQLANAYLNKASIFYFLKQNGEYEYASAILPNLFAFYHWADDKTFINNFRAFQQLFEQNHLTAPLLWWAILEKCQVENPSQLMAPFWQDIVSECERPLLYLAAIRQQRLQAEEQTASTRPSLILEASVYAVFEHPLKSFALWDALYQQQPTPKIAYYWWLTAQAFLKPDLSESFDALLPQKPVNDDLEANYYGALMHLADGSYVEALDFLDSEAHLGMAYCRVWSLKALGRDTDAALQRLLDLEKDQVQQGKPSFLSDFDLNAYWVNDWQDGIHYAMQYEEIAPALTIVLDLLALDAQERGRFQAYQGFVGRNVRQRPLWIQTQKFQPLSDDERLLQQEQFQVALKSSEAFFKHKMSDFQSVMQLENALTREILIAQWIEQRQKRLLNQTHIESIIEYCWANQLLDAFQIWKLLTFAKLNFDLDEKAQSIAKNSLMIYVISVGTKLLLKYGVKTLTAGFAEWVEDSLEDLVSDQFSKFKDQYQLLRYVPYTKFCESI